MKKIKYIIVPALMGIIMASCNSEPKGPTPAELDSQVEAKVKTATDQLKADCDNRIMDAARANADSIMALANKAPKPVAAPAAPPKAHAPAPAKVVTPPPPPVKVDPKKDKMNGGNAAHEQNTQDKKDKMSGKEPNKEENLQKKKDKMSGK